MSSTNTNDAGAVAGHTPGPWSIREHDGRFFIEPASGPQIRIGMARKEADARVMVQAPAFLAACTPERLDALETLLNRVYDMYPLSNCDEEPAATLRAHAEVVPLLSDLRAAVSAAGGAQTP